MFLQGLNNGQNPVALITDTDVDILPLFWNISWFFMFIDSNLKLS